MNLQDTDTIFFFVKFQHTSILWNMTFDMNPNVSFC